MPSAPLDHEELESDGQKALPQRVSGNAAAGKATRADLTRLERIGRYLLHTPRAVWEFPLQNEGSIVMIDVLSDADAAGCPKVRRATSGECLRWSTDLCNLVVDTEGGVTEQRGVRRPQHGTLCE